MAASLEGSPLFNEDLAPTRVAKRTWTTYTFAALWISMAHCIPTYMLASGLISAGMNWWQALVTILVGNVDRARADPRELAPGHEVRHPLPRLRARGLRRLRRERARGDARARRVRLVRHQRVDRRAGAADVLPLALARLADARSATVDARRPLPDRVDQLRCSSGALNILIVFRGMELLRKVENLAAPYVLVMTALLVAWAIMKAHEVGGGLGPIMSGAGQVPDARRSSGRSSCRASRR